MNKMNVKVIKTPHHDSHRELTGLVRITLIIVYTIPYSTIRSMDDHICLVFSGQAFCLINGRILASVFRGDTFITLTPYCPTVLIGYHVLVPGPAL